MKIYGFRLNKSIKYIHPYFCDSCEEGEVLINPEDEISPACHLYEDDFGNQYIGFELSLGLPRDEVETMIGQKCRVFTVNEC